jgi:hypothetical protein
MSPRDIRADRLAAKFWPRLWAFAYPIGGRGWPALRLWAFRLWAEGLRWHLRWRLDRH